MLKQKDSSKDLKVELPSNTQVIACEVFRDELRHLGVEQASCLFIEQGLHRYPEQLNRRLTQSIRHIEEEYSPKKIILVYGYFGGGLEEISTTSADLILAGVHDCIHLFLGRNPDRVGPRGKGTYYLSRGWIKYGKTPYTDYLRLREEFGHEEAMWACNDLLKAYDRVAFVNTLPCNPGVIKAKSEEFARFFRMQHFEMQGDLSLLKNLLGGRTSRRILEVKPRNKITKKHFR